MFLWPTARETVTRSVWDEVGRERVAKVVGADAGKAGVPRCDPAPTEPESVVLPNNPDAIGQLTWQQMRSLAASLITGTPTSDAVVIDCPTTNTEPSRTTS